jgi:hypothetical protein
MGKSSRKKDKRHQQRSGDPRRRDLHPSLRDLGWDDDISIIIVTGDGPAPESAGELLGVMDKPGTLEDGSVLPAGARVYRSNREFPRGEIEADPGHTVLTFGDAEKLPIRMAQVAPVPSVEQVRQAEAAIVQPGHAGLGVIAERLGQTHPGLMAKMASGLNRDELQQLAPQIARAMHAAGAGQGTYTFTDRGEIAEAEAWAVPGGAEIIKAGPSGHIVHGDPEGTGKRRGPEIVITDDLDALETSGVDLVIEDLDPGNPDDAGRVLIGRPEQVRKYHERARSADRRVNDLLGQHGRRAVTTEEAADLIRLRTSWDADTVLGHHAWLTQHYRDPRAALADYLAFIMREQMGESFLSAGIFWPVDLSQGPPDIAEGRQLAHIIARGLGDAETYQVTRGMCEQMRDTWERDEVHTDPLPLSEGELPVPAGFCWLDKPWMIREDEGHWLPVRAVSWERTFVMAGFGDTPPRMTDSVRMAVWLAVDDTVAFGHWEDPERATRTANWLGQVVLHRVIVLPFDFGGHVNRGHSALTGMLGLLHTLWAYLSVELPRSRPTPASNPGVRRRAQRSLDHSDITIITLRKYDYIGDRPAGFPKVIQWSCRWWVETFWRHIDSYDDEDQDGRRRRHKPVPAQRSGAVYDDDHDICAVCYANGQTVRISEVHGFFKGPTDKPIRTPSRERTLQRLSR